MRVLLVTLAFLITFGCQSASIRDYETVATAIGAGEPVAPEELRSSFLAAPDAAERLERLADLETQALQLAADEPLKLGSIGTAILDLYYGSLTGHYVMRRFYEHVENPDTAAVHQAWLDRLTGAVAASGDGSLESPWQVTSALDPSAFLKIRGRDTVGAIYRTGSAEDFFVLVQSRGTGGPIENHHFDLSALYGAVAQASSTPTADAGETGDVPDAVAEATFSPFTFIGYLARRGDSAAQASIGAYLASHERMDDAVGWLRAASREGNLVATSLLARVFWEQSRNAETDAERQAAMDQVLENYLHAVALGSDEAMVALGGLYISEAFGAENAASGVPLLQQAAELGNTAADLYLARLYAQGHLVARDPEAAAERFVRLAEAGDPAAQLAYARFLLDRSVTIPGHSQLQQWLTRLARDHDSDEAMLLLGYLSARGVGGPQDFQQAQQWFQQAVTTSGHDPDMVNEVAWVLAVTDMPELKLANWALEIMESMMTGDDEARQRPEYLDTWAAAHAATGDFSRAVALQEQALVAAEATEDPAVIDEIRSHLEAFRNGESLTKPIP